MFYQIFKGVSIFAVLIFWFWFIWVCGSEILRVHKLSKIKWQRISLEDK
jgi:hypothetical protein